MDYSNSFAISAAGMAVERTRVEVAALNLANAHTVQTPGGVNFRPLQVVARSAASGPGSESFSSRFDSVQASQGVDGTEQAGVPVAVIMQSTTAPQVVHEPGNPFADSKGNVTYPGVNTSTEMVSMMSAMRAYEANVAAMNATRTMALKALEIGGNA